MGTAPVYESRHGLYWGVINGSWMLAPDGWSGGVFVGGVLDYMMVVVSDNSV